MQVIKDINKFTFPIDPFKTEYLLDQSTHTGITTSLSVILFDNTIIARSSA